VAQEPVRYLSADEDSARWIGFEFRNGDIVISTRRRSGTTWVQMICALLIFQAPELPAPLGRISPWLDRLIYPCDELYARLAAQQHRRFIKTHTPLDGVCLDSRACYIVTARHPLDMAVSLYHQGSNINRARLRQLAGQPEPTEPEPERKPLREWLLDWVDHDADPRQELDSLPGVMWHLSDAWARRAEPNVLLIHYDQLSADLNDQMRQIAAWLGITVPERAWPGLVEAVGFEHMRASATQIIGASQILKSSAAFFRRGTSGAGHEILIGQEIAHYHARASELAPRDMLTWLHSPGQSRPI
jgi:aryl sulfotransferase